MSNLFFLAQAAPGQGNSPAMGSQLGFMVFLIVMLIVYWLFLIRPQSKKRKEMAEKLNNLKKGDRVVTVGGVHGKVVSLKEKLVVIRVDDRAEITFDKSAISTIENKNTEEVAAVDNSKKEEIEEEVKKNDEEK